MRDYGMFTDEGNEMIDEIIDISVADYKATEALVHQMYQEVFSNFKNNLLLVAKLHGEAHDPSIRRRIAAQLELNGIGDIEVVQMLCN